MKKLIISVIALSLVSFLGASASAAMPITHLNRLHVIQDLQCATITATTANYSVTGTVTAGVNVVAPAATITVLNATTGNITHVVATDVVANASTIVVANSTTGNITHVVATDVAATTFTGALTGVASGVNAASGTVTVLASTTANATNVVATTIKIAGTVYTAQAVTVDGVALTVLGIAR